MQTEGPLWAAVKLAPPISGAKLEQTWGASGEQEKGWGFFPQAAGKDRELRAKASDPWT